MAIKELLKKWLGIEPVIKERVVYREKAPQGLPSMDAPNIDVIKEQLTFALPGWQNISGQVVSNVDMTEQKRLQLIDKCIELYYYVPEVNKKVELVTSFLFAGEIETTSNIPGFDEIWQTFWKDDGVQQMLRGFSNRLQVFGECFPVLYKTDANGRIELREFDPRTIKSVITTPDDYANIQGYYREWTEQLWDPIGLVYNGGSKSKQYKVIDKITDQQGMSGMQAIMFWKTASFNTQVRGYPDIIPMILPITEYIALLKYGTEAMRASAAYAWDVMLKGATQTDVNTYQTTAEERHPAKPGSKWVHNENIEIKPLSSGMNGMSNAQVLRDAKVRVICAAGIPEALLYMDASNGNYASSKTLIDYAVGQLYLEYKDLWSCFIREMHNKYYLLAQGIIDTDALLDFELPKDEEGNIQDFVTIRFPEVSDQDFLQRVQAYALGISSGFLSRQQACEDLGFDWEKINEQNLAYMDVQKEKQDFWFGSDAIHGGEFNPEGLEDKEEPKQDGSVKGLDDKEKPKQEVKQESRKRK